MAAVRRQGGRRTLVLTTASAPRFCRVCDDARSVRIVDFPGLAMHGGGEATCPHCSSEPGKPALPIYMYAMRTDQRRSES